MSYGVFGVSEVNFYLKSLLAEDSRLQSLLVRGEVSNFKNYPSGHAYFSLKDDESLLKCVMFKRFAQQVTFVPQNGMRVVAQGRIDLYEAGGVYQLYVTDLIPDGAGAAALALEQCKQRLQKEGLFDQRFKKTIPLFSRRVGVIAGDGSAAFADIARVLAQAAPQIEILFCPAQVQGAGADLSVMRAMRRLDEGGLCDVIVCARGGGSAEDLSAFNSEALARAAFDCKTPLISAIGHEIDYSILDFVADERALTPTDAAGKVSRGTVQFRQSIPQLQKMLNQRMQYRFEDCARRLERVRVSRVFTEKGALPAILLDRNREKARRLERLMVMKIQTAVRRTAVQCEKLELLSPLATLRRGYAITLRDGQALNAETLAQGDSFSVLTKTKQIQAIVQSVSEHPWASKE